MADIERIIAALEKSSIPYALPGSDAFRILQTSYTGRHDTKRPKIITRPQSSEDVQTILINCNAQNVPIVIRGGGHDMFERFTVTEAVSIDLRDLKTVKVSPDKKSVSVGGGATVLHVLESLEPQGLQVPVGTCGTVGFVGWSLVGGFGPYIHSYGLGCDQIVGAKVVTADGKLVKADQTLLKGLRGGGACLSIVVELRVKTYSMQEVQAGMIFFESSDIHKTVSTFFTNYNTLTQQHQCPKDFSLMPGTWLVPGMGLTLMCAFVWNGPRANLKFDVWLKRVSDLCPLHPDMPGPQDAVAQSSALGFAVDFQKVLPKEVVGWPQVATVNSFSPDVVSCLAEAATKMPLDGASGINIHIVRADNPSMFGDVPDSVCPYREAHVMIEILGLGTDESSASRAAEWAWGVRAKLVALKDASQRTYLAVTSPEHTNLERIYGEKLEELKKFKAVYDPTGVFRNAVPQIG